jgi:tol-pal system protein YbgF
MRQTGWLKCLATGIFLTVIAACDTSFLYPRQPPPPPTGSPAPAPTASAPAPAPDTHQQLRTLEDKVRHLERRVAALEVCTGTAKPAPAAPGTARPAEKAPPHQPASPAAEKLYSDGLRLYQTKKYLAARDKFSQYLSNQPQGPKAAEARYYLGESFYQEKRYAEAREEFNKVVTQYPGSILAPTALLRQAYAYQQLNQKANYSDSLKRLIQQYPQSPEAQEARRQLKSGEPPR